jgi:hypothetical protein
MIFLGIYKKKIKILLTGHSRQPAIRHGAGRFEFFNPQLLFSPPRSAPF